MYIWILLVLLINTLNEFHIEIPTRSTHTYRRACYETSVVRLRAKKKKKGGGLVLNINRFLLFFNYEFLRYTMYVMSLRIYIENNCVKRLVKKNK